MKRNSGFTLSELIIAITTVATIVVFAVPSLSHILKTNRSASETNEFLSVLQLARNTAVAQSVRITLCRGSTTCGDTTWTNGWMMFTDRNGNRVVDVDDGDGVIRTEQDPVPGYTLSWRAFGSNDYIQFTPEGRLHGQNGTFLFCPTAGNVRYARGVIVSRTGRARATRDSDGDTIHEDALGRPLTCP